LGDAQLRKVSSPVKDLLILCCSFLPLIGKHSAAILAGVRVAAFAVLALLVGYIGWMTWKSKSREAAPKGREEPSCRQ
jgi:hypothetical protein